MAQSKHGTKVACTECEAKFYDLDKSTPVCPKCGASQTARPTTSELKTPVRTVKKKAAAKPAAKETEEVVETDPGAAKAGLEVVSMDDAIEDDDDDEVEDDAAAVAALGIEDVESDDDDDSENNDAFLEDEDEDGANVADLVGTPISKNDGDS